MEKMSDSEFLNWLADRLVNVYGENPNVDFVHATRRIAAALASREGPAPVLERTIISRAKLAAPISAEKKAQFAASMATLASPQADPSSWQSVEAAPKGEVMKVETITVESFVILEAPSLPNRGALDPITVFLRDFGGSGQIVVECYGDAWSTGFGAIGQKTLRAFLASVAAPYLGGRLTASTCRRTAKREEAYVERIAGAVIAALAAPVQAASSKGD